MGHITKAMKRERARIRAARKLPAEVAIGAALMLGGELCTLTNNQANSSYGGCRYYYRLLGYRSMWTKPYRKIEYAARAFIRMYEKEFPNGRSHT